MSYAANSREAYASIVHRISDKQTEVLMALMRSGAMTNKEISRYMDREINTITPRTGELFKMGLIFEKDKVPDFETGRTASRWEAYMDKLI